MKKLLSALILLPLVVMGGCGAKPTARYEPFVPPIPTVSSSSVPVTESALEFADIKPDTVVVRDAAFGQRLSQSMAELPLQEVAKPKQFRAGSFLPQQLARVFRTGDILVGLVQHASMNTFLQDNTPTTTGVWYAISSAATTTLEWKPWLDIVNTEWPENNPFFLWGDEKELKLLVIDNRGAGSGEGTAKVLVSENEGVNWRTERCFYYVPEAFPAFMNGDIVRDDFETNLQKNISRSESKFNSTTGQFEFTQVNKYTGRAETIVDAQCGDIILP